MSSRLRDREAAREREKEKEKEDKDAVGRAESRRIKRDRTSDATLSVDSLVTTQKADVDDDLETEKQKYVKAQRINERIMTQLEEATIHAAALEAQFRVRERNWKDKLDELENSLAKLRNEEQVERTRLKEEIAKFEAKIKGREKEHDTRLERKARDHDDGIKKLKQQIEQAKKANEDVEKAAELETQIRNEKALINEAEADVRKMQSEYENEKDALETTKAKIASLNEKVEETEKGNAELSTAEEKVNTLEKQLKELEKRIDELEEIEVNNKDNQEVIADLKNKIRVAKTTYDETLAEKNNLDNRVSRAKSGVDANKTDRTTNTSRLEAINRKETSALGRVDAKKESRLSARPDRGGAAGGTALDKIRERQAGRTTEGSRGDERKIKGARQAVKTYERESKRELDGLDKQLGKAEAGLSKMEAAFAKCEDNEKAMVKLIKQEKETYEQRVDIMKSQQDLVEKDVDKTAAELKHLQKAFKDGEFNREEKKTLLDKLTADLNAKKKELANVEMAIKQRERTIERADRELRGLIKTWQDTTFKHSETEALRADTQQTQEETHLDFEIAKKDLQLEIHTLESEIYDQTEQREHLVKLNAELLKEVQDLRWYFKPQREKGEVESRIYGTREFDEINKQRSQRESEIDLIKKEVGSVNIEHDWKNKTMQDLKKELDKTLQDMDPDMRGDILFELKDLTEAMKNQLFNQRRILAIVSMLAKHEVYPGAIRELSVLTKMNDELHVMQRPEMLLKITHREFTRDPEAKTFRRRLLEKLVEMRTKRTNRTYQQAEDFIFYGEERGLDEIVDELEDLGEDMVDELPEDDE